VRKLSEEQEVAVLAEGCTLLLAGAGSGKTTVLTRRIANLIFDGVEPSSILATTFTNKAAAEIKERAKNLTGGVADGVLIGTFHSIATHFLRQAFKKDAEDESLLIDGRSWTNSFSIYDGADYRSLFQECCKAVGLDSKSTPVYEGAVSALKNKGFGILNDSNFPDIPDVIRKLFYLSLDKSSESNAMGYDDLLWNFTKLIHNEDCNRELIRLQYHHYLVDECQDMNSLQLLLISLLVTGSSTESLPQDFDWSGRDFGGMQRSFFLVGDIDQSIYSWRGAEPKLSLQLPTTHQAKILKLEQNYRSVPRILELANTLIAKNSDRIPKVLIPTREPAPVTPTSPISPVTFRWNATDLEEAQWVGQKIREELDSGVELRDIAVLYRTNSQSRVLESVLSGTGISYRIIGSHRFYDRREIKDILGYLIFTNNPKDNTIFKRIVNVPRRGIGGVTLNQIESLSQLRKQSLWDVVCTGLNDLKLALAARAGLASFVSVIKELKGRSLSPTLIEDVISITGYDNYLQSLGEDECKDRQANLAELQHALDTHVDSGKPKTIQSFLETITFSEKAEDNNSISLMTCHAAKGLEFPIVFVVGLEEDTFPSRRSQSPAEMEEERRLMYVAMTRAKDRLYLSGAVFKYGADLSPSRFLLEMKDS
jgi:DNA helicase II / ATP-dependent DNA helicase PcrA